MPDTPMPRETSGARDLHDAPLWAAAGVPVGAAAEPALLTHDADYRRTLVQEFNAITPENVMKWALIHPFEQYWTFDPADRLVDFAMEHGLRIHGHTLVWYKQLPGWLSLELTQRQARHALASHIETLVGRYAGRLASWDVVNEAIERDGSLRDSYFLRTIGADYIAEAFRWAHHADPGARLYYNDYGAEGLGAKSDGVYRLVRGLLEEGIPVHGVGLQMHLRADRPTPPADIVRISEMDVAIRDVHGGNPLFVQRAVYHDALAACVGRPGLTGVTFWGVGDAHSWIPNDAPLLFDRAYAPKPAYFGVRDALAGA
jgi:endo-1,4-beta-xylanase